jgi:hypothetical protein
MSKSFLLAAAFLASSSLAVAAPDPVRTETVQFAKGTSSRTLASSVKGYATVNYLVDVRAGQTLKVSMKTNNASSYFNITAPGADEALFVGSASGNSYAGKIASSGVYKVQVSLMRNAARRNETASYTLTIGAKG